MRGPTCASLLGNLPISRSAYSTYELIVGHDKCKWLSSWLMLAEGVADKSESTQEESTLLEVERRPRYDS